MKVNTRLCIYYVIVYDYFGLRSTLCIFYTEFYDICGGAGMQYQVPRSSDQSRTVAQYRLGLIADDGG